jgi:hypothetical protein
MHVALWVLAATSLVGAVVCLLRPKHLSVAESATLSFEEHSAHPDQLDPGQADPGEIAARGRVHA